MRSTFALLLLALTVFACAKGYKEGEPLRGEELALANKATEMAKKAEDLAEDATSDLGQTWKGFLENARLFDNSCQRHSCNSLEARNDFNHLRYYAVQLDSVITERAYPSLYPKWREIRVEYVDAIGKELGYRIQ